MMKHARSHYFRNSKKPGISDRSATFILLALPLAIAIIALVLASITTAMGQMKPGSFRFYLGAMSYSILLAAFFCMPAYLISCGWYWWRTSTDFSIEKLIKNLWFLPLIAGLFSWFPSLLIPQISDAGKPQVLLLLILLTLLIGYPWIGFVRFILRVWRKV